MYLILVCMYNACTCTCTCTCTYMYEINLYLLDILGNTLFVY